MNLSMVTFRKPHQFGKLLRYKFIVKCPHCQRLQGYIPRDKRINSNTRKTCIFCGRSFKVRENLIKEADHGEFVEK